MRPLETFLAGGDLRSIGNADRLLARITTESQFGELFACLFSSDRRVVMRAADVIEKITRRHDAWLRPYTREVIRLMERAQHKELKWHLAQLSSRLMLSTSDLALVWKNLSAWCLDASESRIVRVNSLQALWELQTRGPGLHAKLRRILKKMGDENIPSIQARIRKIQHNIKTQRSEHFTR